MTKKRHSKSKHSKLSLVKKIGISFVIPIFLAIVGGILVLTVGWNYILKAFEFGDAIFYKTRADLDRYEYNINDVEFLEPIYGEKIATLEIPAVELNNVIYQGDDEGQLSIGIGHNIYSTFPGEGGKVVLAAHRDGYFAPLQYVEIGDEVIVKTDYGTYYYAVENIRITEPDDLTVTEPTDREMLTMYTCYPFSYIGNAPQRYIVDCEFVRVE